VSFVSVYAVNISFACDYSLQTCSSVSVVTKLQSGRPGREIFFFRFL